VRDFLTLTEELGDGKTVFKKFFDEQRASSKSPWAPFIDKDKWELARWLTRV
jgi:hypothetical protein